MITIHSINLLIKINTLVLLIYYVKWYQIYKIFLPPHHLFIERLWYFSESIFIQSDNSGHKEDIFEIIKSRIFSFKRFDG